MYYMLFFFFLFIQGQELFVHLTSSVFCSCLTFNIQIRILVAIYYTYIFKDLLAEIEWKRIASGHLLKRLEAFLLLLARVNIFCKVWKCSQFANICEADKGE